MSRSSSALIAAGRGIIAAGRPPAESEISGADGALCELLKSRVNSLWRLPLSILISGDKLGTRLGRMSRIFPQSCGLRASSADEPDSNTSCTAGSHIDLPLCTSLRAHDTFRCCIPHSRCPPVFRMRNIQPSLILRRTVVCMPIWQRGFDKPPANGSCFRPFPCSSFFAVSHRHHSRLRTCSGV